MQRQYRRRSKHVYPNSLGVTGQAFMTGEIIICNKMSKLSNFLPSIDNLSRNVKDVHSIMIVPIYGHREKFEDWGKEIDTSKKRMPIGILQFINKLEFKQIDDYDKVSTTTKLLKVCNFGFFGRPKFSRCQTCSECR